LYTQNSQLLDLIGDEDLLYYIHSILKDKKITSDAYADIFCLIHSREAVSEEMLTYDTESDTWHRGTKVLTDARLFGLLNTVCEIITLYVDSAWEDSLFSAWMSDKPLKRAQKAMEDMESLSSLRIILSRCAETLSYGKQSPKGDDYIDWESETGERNPDLEEHLDEEE